MNLIATLILTLSDAFWYGYCYEKRGWFKSWLFKEYPFKGETWVPFYRVFIQWHLDGWAIYLVYHYCGIWALILMLLSWFCQIKEGGYYIILGQWKNLKNGDNMYWLNRIYFSQWWFYENNFKVKYFAWSLIVGLAFLITSNFI